MPLAFVRTALDRIGLHLTLTPVPLQELAAQAIGADRPVIHA